MYIHESTVGSGGIIIICSNHMSGKGVLYAFTDIYRRWYHRSLSAIPSWGKATAKFEGEVSVGRIGCKAAVAAISATMQATAKKEKIFLT